jgi:hypothetical protein
MLKKPQYKKTVTLGVPQQIPGVPHTVEGYTPPTYNQPQNFGSMPSPQDDPQRWQQRRRNLGEKTIAIKKDKAFKKKQAARARLKPIISPDEGVSNRRRAAAKRQQKGRLGTMLSQRETLG